MGFWTRRTDQIPHDPALMKRWDEAVAGRECAYSVAGAGVETMVCGAPAEGAYCARHLEHIRGRVVPQEGRPRLRPMQEIVEEVAARHGVTVSQIKGPLRRCDIVRARQEAYALLWIKGDLRRSSPIVARFLGRLNHTTVIGGAKAHRAREAERMAAE